MRTGFIAMRLGIVKYIVPFLFVYSPNLLMTGPILHIIIAVISGIIGVTILSIGLEGFFLKRINPMERSLFIIGGFLTLMPFHISWEIMAAGILLSVLAVTWHVKSTRKVALQ